MTNRATNGDDPPPAPPLLVEFTAPSSLLLEVDRASPLPVVRNGPPGTFVRLPGGLRVSLPTDQVVFADDTGGRARVGFGGMRFIGCEAEQLVFVRARELHPEEQLSPARSHTMRLTPTWVTALWVAGHQVWPAPR